MGTHWKAIPIPTFTPRVSGLLPAAPPKDANEKTRNKNAKKIRNFTSSLPQFCALHGIYLFERLRNSLLKQSFLSNSIFPFFLSTYAHSTRNGELISIPFRNFLLFAGIQLAFREWSSRLHWKCSRCLEVWATSPMKFQSAIGIESDRTQTAQGKTKAAAIRAAANLP